MDKQIIINNAEVSECEFLTKTGHCKTQDAISKLCTEKSALYNELDQLKQTLTEIKEIAEYELNNLTDSAVHGGRYLEILQKISEVKKNLTRKDKTMPYKRTEIGSIDVIGCNFYKKGGKCLIPHYQQNIKYSCCNCLEWDCYYKQLKRKEQECERLKHDNEYEVGALEKTIDNLIVESEELKNCLDEIKEIANYSFNCSTSKYMAKLDLILEKINEVQNDKM